MRPLEPTNYVDISWYYHTSTQVLLKFPPQFAYQIAHGTSMLENKLYGIQSDGATTLKILNIPKKITHMYKAIYVEIPFLKI